MRIKMVLSGLLLACLMISGLVHATVATYAIELRVDSVQLSPYCNSNLSNRAYVFGCVAVGDVFHGSFGVDTSILSTDGIVNTAPIFDFKLAFGNVFYSTGPDNLSLAGFRSGQGFADAPGYVIEGGEVVDLVGGVYGLGDVPFIDFFPSYGRNRFGATDWAATTALGELLIQRIPEPSSLVLLGLALAGLAVSIRKRATSK